MPYSRVGGNRSYRHRVCDVEVLVVGPSHRSKEVKDALGSCPLRRLRLKDFNRQTCNINIDSDYDGDNESNDEYNMLQKTCQYTIPVLDTDITEDSDYTKLDTDSDCTKPDSDCTKLDSDCTKLDSD